MVPVFWKATRCHNDIDSHFELVDGCEVRLDYMQPRCTRTLEQGLEEYYAGHAGLSRERGMSAPARAWFRSHDVVHVVFGCDTSLVQEAMVKVWAVFGTTGGLRSLRGYRYAESKAIYRTIAWTRVPHVALQCVVALPRVMWRCLWMRKRWPWSDFDRHLTRPLLELRKEYGIVPLTRAAESKAIAECGD
jgi:hypothetical protein